MLINIQKLLFDYQSKGKVLSSLKWGHFLRKH